MDATTPVLVWELIEQTGTGVGRRSIDVSRARVHQGWLIKTVLYDENRQMLNVTIAPYSDPNYAWDGHSHLA